jgi:1-acyl-sn-glycerol-3-phosphate acyltransferase
VIVAQSWFYKVSWWIIWVVLKILLRFRTEGTHHVPMTGGVLLASNHASLVDPPLVGVCLQRELSFLAKRELFRSSLFGRLIRSLHAIPIDRGGVTHRTLKTVVERLREGRAVLVFPEGTRTKTGRLGGARAGIGFLAAMSGCPVLPVAITGTYRVWRTILTGRRVTVRFGAPIVPQELGTHSLRKEGYRCISDHLMQHIAALHSGCQLG